MIRKGAGGAVEGSQVQATGGRAAPGSNGLPRLARPEGARRFSAHLRCANQLTSPSRRGATLRSLAPGYLLCAPPALNDDKSC